MSNKTIAKFASVVILFAFVSVSISSCSHASPRPRQAVNASELSPDYTKPAIVGYIESPEIQESSGIASSLCQQDVLWTHNDSGDDAFIFAMNSKGKHLGTWRVAGARNDDWEDMASYKDASGTCFLYIGDIGNNDLGRVNLDVYRVKEPVISSGDVSSTKKRPLMTEPAEVMQFRYSDTPHNAETMMVEPRSGTIYVLTKRLDGPSGVFKITPSFGSTSRATAQLVADLAVPSIPNGLLTGGAISPDGKRVAICDYSAAYVMDANAAGNFDDVWKQRPVQVDLGDRKQGEAITFEPDGNGLIATSEKKNAPLIEVKRK